MKKHLTLLLLIFFTSAARAEEIDPRYFKDWLSLSDLLQSKGIPPYSPSWGIINPICLPLKTSIDETGFNRCLYEKAMNEYQWQVDSKYCKEKSEKDYSYYIRKERHTSGVLVNIGSQRVLLDTPYSYVNGNRRTKDKDVFYSECMIEGLNWINPDQWATGHREITR